MNTDVRCLLDEVPAARAEVLAENVQEVLEHLVLAERGGFDLIHTAATHYRAAQTERSHAVEVTITYCVR